MNVFSCSLQYTYNTISICFQLCYVTVRRVVLLSLQSCELNDYNRSVSLALAPLTILICDECY